MPTRIRLKYKSIVSIDHLSLQVVGEVSLVLVPPLPRPSPVFVRCAGARLGSQGRAAEQGNRPAPHPPRTRQASAVLEVSNCFPKLKLQLYTIHIASRTPAIDVWTVADIDWWISGTAVKISDHAAAATAVLTAGGQEKKRGWRRIPGTARRPHRAGNPPPHCLLAGESVAHHRTDN